jgi:hypothetical protein
MFKITLISSIIIMLLIPSLINAKNLEPIGKIVKVKKLKKVGSLRVHHYWGNRDVDGYKNQILYDQDSLYTDPYTKGYLKLIDSSKLFMDKNSHLQIKSNTKIKHKKGTTEYNIKKRKPKMRLQIETNFATVFVTGTRFKIYDEKNLKKIELYEGELKIKLKTGVQILNDTGECTSYRHDTKRIMTLLAGESATFKTNSVIKRCHLKSEANLKKSNTISIFYLPFKDRHQCGAHTKNYKGTKRKIVALEENCLLTIKSNYEGCDLIAQKNIAVSKVTKIKNNFHYLLKPYKNEEKAFTQYRCNYPKK